MSSALVVDKATSTPTLLSPGQLGRLRLKNRVVMAPVDSVIRNEDGGSTERHARYLGARARGGVGMIILDNTIIRWPEGSVGSKSLRIDQDRFIPSLGEAIDEVHRYDALIAAQINHAGRQTTLGGSQGLSLVSASAIAWPDSGTVPRELARDELAALRREFTEAAVRAAKAGFDAVEVHAAHGYLLSSFLSPALNQRTDEYGGSTENRVRIVQEIIADIQNSIPDMPILVRMNCVDGIPGGIDTDEAVELAGLLAATGIDGLDVSAGTYEASALTFPPMMTGEARLMDRIRRVKAAVDVPVIGVGRISRPETAEQYLADGTVDFVALGRALIADPDWAAKTARGRSDTIRHCIGCNHGCIRRIDLDLTMKCNVNPDVGQEGRDRTPPAHRIRRVLVAGGGPAGAEFSLRAAKSGHEVDLFEAGPILGGQLVHARIPDFKHDLGILRDYYETVIGESDVRVHLDSPVTAELVAERNPDLVIIAVGADPIPLTGIVDTGDIETVTFADVLQGASRPSGDVTVVGGGPNGCETAVFLAQLGASVTVVEMTGMLAAQEDHSVRSWVLSSFEEYGITAHVNSRVVDSENGAVIIEDSDGERTAIPTGTLVSAVGMRPRTSLEAELRESGVPFEVLGDARGVGTILEATERAAWLAERMTLE